MPVTITPLLAERLDISEDRTRSLLKSMLQELRSRAEADGVQLSELGTFREEDGTLTFVPSDSLRRRVNHQFEGLSPEDLAAPSSSEPDTEAPPTLRESSGDTDQPGASLEEPAVEEASPSEEAPEEEASEGEASEDESIPTIDPVEQKDEPPSSPPEEPAFEEPAGPPPPDASEDTTEDRKESIPTLDPIENEGDTETDDTRFEDESDEPSPPLEEDTKEDEESDPFYRESPMGSFSLIGSLLLIVILAVVGWFVFSETNLWSSAEPSAPYESSESPQSTESSSQEPGAEPAPDANNTSGDEHTERYPGVKPGDENERAASTSGPGNWTIVVASRTSQAEAEAMTDPYEDQFDTVTVVPGTVNNTTWYRVTVGRYDSEAAAESVLDDHASALPGDAWTHQLR